LGPSSQIWIENITKAIAAAITNLLRPLVMFLLRNGVPYQTFADIAKRVYVDLATEKFDIPGGNNPNRGYPSSPAFPREVLRVKRLPAQGRSWVPGSDQPGGACHHGLGAGPQVQR